MNNKEGFIIYKEMCRPILDLSNEELGKVFRWIIENRLDEEGIEEPNGNLKIVIGFFKNQFRLDDMKYEDFIEKQRENGLKGGRPKQNPDEPKKPKPFLENPSEPKKPYKEKEKDKVKDKENINNKTISKGIGEAPFKVNETLKPKQIKKDKRNPQITEIVDYLKNKIGYLDETETWNRRYASSLLKRLKKQYPDKDPIATARALIDIGIEDEFHSKNLTNFRYLFNNQQKILRGFKDNRKNIIIID